MTRNRGLFGVLALAALSSGTLGTSASGQTAVKSAPPIRRALDFLQSEQLQKPVSVLIENERVQDYPGDWPQFFVLRGAPAFRVRDVSPFTVAFIHHALGLVVEDNRLSLGLSPRDIRAARTMRRRAVEFLTRFESKAGAADAGTFGFWPYDQFPDLPGPFVGYVLVSWLRGPLLGGDRVPLNLHVFPNALAIPTDADVTATTYAALLDDAILDGGPGSNVPFSRFFVDWRDLGEVRRRVNPPWLPQASGGFLTWLNYRDRDLHFPNDVDLVVNANVLFALGRYNRLDVPGVTDAVGLINLATALGLYRDHFAEISLYYPDNLVFQYAVSRAFHEGGVSTLAPAVEILADDLESTAIERSDGTAYWHYGAPQLNTAFAILTLLNAGRDTPLVARAVAYLVSEQSARGGFAEAPFFFAQADAGQVFEFSSASFTTAMALEALARYALRETRHERP